MTSAIFFFRTAGPNGYLSNFSTETPFTDPDTGFQYKTSEHYFMVQKALQWSTAKNGNLVKQMLLCETPQAVKKLGRCVEQYDEAVWSAVRFDAMVRGLRMKFTQNPAHKDRLLATGSAVLVEASPYDKLWGIGMTEKDAMKLTESERQSVLKSRNLLGKALMVVRDELRHQ